VVVPISTTVHNPSRFSFARLELLLLHVNAVIKLNEVRDRRPHEMLDQPEMP